MESISSLSVFVEVGISVGLHIERMPEDTHSTKEELHI